MPDPDATWNRVPGGRGAGVGSVPRCPSDRADSGRPPVDPSVVCGLLFSEQERVRPSKGFTSRPVALVIDGFAVSDGRGAWAASLDARPAIPARWPPWSRCRVPSAATCLGPTCGRTTTWSPWCRGTVPIAAKPGVRGALAELTRQVQRPGGCRRRSRCLPRMIRIVRRRGKPPVLAARWSGDHRNGSRGIPVDRGACPERASRPAPLQGLGKRLRPPASAQR